MQILIVKGFASYKLLTIFTESYWKFKLNKQAFSLATDRESMVHCLRQNHFSIGGWHDERGVASKQRSIAQLGNSNWLNPSQPQQPKVPDRTTRQRGWGHCCDGCSAHHTYDGMRVKSVSQVSFTFPHFSHAHTIWCVSSKRVS